ncbi:MAG TPA: heme peroxidase family protein [Pyrinomonadaceae bacterium]
MTTVLHGSVPPLELAVPEPEDDETPQKLADPYYPPWKFGYMFPDLQHDSQNRLETGPRTFEGLRELGSEGMKEPLKDENDDFDEIIPGVPVPTIYTFFGQFVDHDITFERGSRNINLKTAAPIDPKYIEKFISNSRSPTLDLDNIYGPNFVGELSPRDPQRPDKMRIDKAILAEPSRGLAPGKDLYNDLPRGEDGKALIGDPRDDQNVILAQLHVAFLRAHNSLVDRGLKFGEAQKQLRQHYQWIVLDDFLERIADPNIVKRVRYRGPKFFNPSAKTFFMPFEFSIAAFRFGHSKVRKSYSHFNSLQKSAELDDLFKNAGRPLLSDWIIDWSAFLDAEGAAHFPRPIDPALTATLSQLKPAQIGEGDPENNLAVRNLLRGYIFSLPTGQAVADAMASQGIKRMTPAQIMSWAIEYDVKEQIEILKNFQFLERTPLWFYILAEATYYSRGYHLGPVGSTIVAEVLIGILRNSTDSILCDPHWRPTLGRTPGKFDLEDLLRLAGVY